VGKRAALGLGLLVDRMSVGGDEGANLDALHPLSGKSASGDAPRAA
jgi:hypothetical protein